MNTQITTAAMKVNNSVRQNFTVRVTIERRLVLLSGTKFSSSVEVSLKLSSQRMNLSSSACVPWSRGNNVRLSLYLNSRLDSSLIWVRRALRLMSSVSRKVADETKRFLSLRYFSPWRFFEDGYLRMYLLWLKYRTVICYDITNVEC